MPPIPPDAIIFDLDGVLADTEPIHALALQGALADRGHRFDLDWFENWIGVNETAVLDHLANVHQIDIVPAHFRHEKSRHFHDLLPKKLQPFSGLSASISSFPGPCAVATSSSRIDAVAILNAVNLHHHFSVIVTADDVTHTKPNPEPYLTAAEQLGVPAASCTVIEDSPPGISAARAAGCTVLAVTTTHQPDALCDAHHVFADCVTALNWLGVS